MDSRTIPRTIILCGGTGMRLREETEFKPKPMVMIGDQPILWHIMKIYEHHGYRDFILALGYKGDMIVDYFWKRDDFRIIFAETGLETPHGERILKLKKYIDEPFFMVTYGDGLADIDLKKLVEFHQKKGVIATITGAHTTSRWGLVKTDKNDLVINFNQKPILSEYINGGFMVFNRKFFDVLKAGDMIEDGLKRLIPDRQVALYKHEGFWFGMDTYKDFKYLNELWEKKPPWKIWK